MVSLRISNKNISCGRYLAAGELSLPFQTKIRLLLLGFAKIGSFQPKGFTAPEDFYVVKDRVGCFISYRQGFDEVFYPPEVAT